MKKLHLYTENIIFFKFSFASMPTENYLSGRDSLTRFIITVIKILIMIIIKREIVPNFVKILRRYAHSVSKYACVYLILKIYLFAAGWKPYRKRTKQVSQFLWALFGLATLSNIFNFTSGDSVASPTVPTAEVMWENQKIYPNCLIYWAPQSSPWLYLWVLKKI